MNIQFGSGVLYGLPNAGDLAANPTPYKFGVLQEASVEFKGDIKKLYGQSQFPVSKARGKVDVSCKAKIAVLDPAMLNQLYFGQVKTTGMKVMAVDEAGTVPAVTTFTILVSQHTTFETDFGVIDTATGTQLEKVASGPATGQYSVDATTGTYTFAAADANKAVKISYTYSVTTGSTITITNQLMGYAPEFRSFLFNKFKGKRWGIDLNSCMMAQMSTPTKNEDYWMADITFDASCDASDVLGKLFAD
jgi:hypothetical protein